MSQHPPATITEFDGVRYLHLGTEAIQGAMRLLKPDTIEIEYVQQMMAWTLFQREPRHIVQLGLGSGALTRFCHRQFPAARVTAIELNPNVIDICHSMFGLPANDARLNVLAMDALPFVMRAENRGTVDVLQVDLYDAQAQGPVFDTPEFYAACAGCLSATGIMTVNLYGSPAIYEKNLAAMEPAFDAVAWLPEVHDENIVVIAFKQAPVIDFNTLYQRAGAIKRTLNLPAKSWVNGLKDWMRDS